MTLSRSTVDNISNEVGYVNPLTQAAREADFVIPSGVIVTLGGSAPGSWLLGRAER